MDDHAKFNPDFNLDILDLKQTIVFFPVRHHSPAAARLLKQCIEQVQPTAILIEGPSDFNDRLAELKLPHRLPIAIYSYFQDTAGRRGAFYPFCIYSPEWQALTTAFEQNIIVKFIDRPWSAMGNDRLPQHRYGDGALAHNPAVTALCKTLGVESFDEVWDTLFEIDRSLSLGTYLERCHRLCFHLRTDGTNPSESDRLREGFMASKIEAMRDQLQDLTLSQQPKILVVTGGFHSYALFCNVYQRPFENHLPPVESILRPVNPVPPGEGLESGKSEESIEVEEGIPRVKILQQGIALTPYAYDRLDRLTGYESGMANPGFYHQVWNDRLNSQSPPSYQTLLAKVVSSLRHDRQQGVSAADLIAVNSTAQALAHLRGHSEVWRQDLIDGILSALVKDEISQGLTHPLLEAVYQVFRGNDRGQLAPGTILPPLVIEIQAQLAALDLQPELTLRCINLDLYQALDLEKSQFLYQLKGLNIRGYKRLAGTDFIERQDLAEIWEQWEIAWSPEFEANCIEAAIYGSHLAEAATNVLLERSEAIDRNAEQAAQILLESCLMGLTDLSQTLTDRLQHLIRQDSDFLNLSKALGHLLYLYRYDTVLGHIRSETLGELLRETFHRSLWILETLGTIVDAPQPYIQGLKNILEVFERCTSMFADDRVEFVQILQRFTTHLDQHPSLKGGAIGALWRLGEMDLEAIFTLLKGFSSPEQLGDFLTGLFQLAREVIQRHPGLIQAIDAFIMDYSRSQFLEALPALRLAFSVFPPREKHRLTTGLFSEEVAYSLDLALNPEIAAAIFALEAQVQEQWNYYGFNLPSKIPSA